jgi:hypothetical protein
MYKIFIYSQRPAGSWKAREERYSMAEKAKILSRVPRGIIMKPGKGWRLASPGETRGFKATLIKRIDVGGEIIAIFRVWPTPDKRV